MKLFRLLTILFVTVITVALIQSCSSDNNVSGNNDGDVQEFVLINHDVSDFSMVDATENSEIGLDDCQPMNPDLRDTKNKMSPNANKRLMLDKVFRSMKLTDEQKAKIRELMNAHIRCEMQWFRKLQAAREEIVNRSNAAIRNVMEQVKSGKLTRQEAQRQIQQINMKTREAIKNLPINDEILKGIIRCREEFFAAVASLLNDEQLAIWKRFLASTSTGAKR